MFLVLVGELQGLERIDCSTGVNIAQAPAKLNQVLPQFCNHRCLCRSAWLKIDGAGLDGICSITRAI